jgi:hypothetical protein
MHAHVILFFYRNRYFPLPEKKRRNILVCFSITLSMDFSAGALDPTGASRLKKILDPPPPPLVRSIIRPWLGLKVRHESQSSFHMPTFFPFSTGSWHEPSPPPHFTLTSSQPHANFDSLSIDLASVISCPTQLYPPCYLCSVEVSIRFDIWSQTHVQ